MTDPSKLPAEAAAISAKGSPNVRAFAIDSAAVAVDHEARLAKLEAAQPGPVTPPPAPTPTPPPAPTPTPPATMRVGVTANEDGWGLSRQKLVLAMGAKLLREDRNDWSIPFARANGLTTIGVIYLDPLSVGTGCDIIELDNEPWNTPWVNGDVHAYAVKVRDLAKQVRAAYPSKPILVSVGPPWNNGDVQLPDGTWRDCVLAYNDAAPDLWGYVTGVAIHPYSQPNPPVPGVMGILDKWRGNLRAVGHDLPFWVTEVGWPTTAGSGSVTEALQATYVGDFIDHCAARGDVAAVTVYQLVDQATSDTGNAEMHFGLMHTDGSPKPAYAAVKSRLTA